MAQPKAPKIPSPKRNPGALVEQLQVQAKPARRSSPVPNGAARRNGRSATHNGVGDGSHPQSFRQLLRKGKENGHVEGTELLRVLPGHVLGAPEKLEEVLALFRRQGFGAAAVIGEVTADAGRLTVV